MRFLIPIEGFKIGYIQMPKVANTSIVSIFGQINGYLPENIENLSPVEMHKIVTRNKIRLTKKNLDNFDDYFKFSFVRNPYSRAFSTWNDKVNGEKEFLSFRKYGLRNKMTFKDFLRKIKDIEDKRSEIHFASQSHILTINQRLIADRIWKLENKNSWTEFQEVASDKGLKMPSLPNLNSTNSGCFMDFYDSECVKLVNQRYANDFEKFNYKMES